MASHVHAATPCIQTCASPAAWGPTSLLKMPIPMPLRSTAANCILSWLIDHLFLFPWRGYQLPYTACCCLSQTMVLEAGKNLRDQASGPQLKLHLVAIACWLRMVPITILQQLVRCSDEDQIAPCAGANTCHDTVVLLSTRSSASMLAPHAQLGGKMEAMRKPERRI